MRKFGHRYEHSQRVELVKTEGEDSHMQAKERGLSGDEPCGHRDLRLQPPKLGGNTLLLCKPFGLGNFVIAAPAN